MALTANTSRAFEQGDRNEFGVSATTVVYEGAAVGLNPATGLARPVATGDIFAGFAEAKADNSAGAAGAINVRVKDEGKVILAISGVAITDIGKAVYATDDNTFTLTQGTGVYVGRISRWISSGIALVSFESEFGGIMTELTNSTGGTATLTLNDVTATPTQALINNNFASVLAVLNSILRMAR